MLKYTVEENIITGTRVCKAGKEGRKVKYEKPKIELIDLEKDNIIITSVGSEEFGENLGGWSPTGP